jgi:CRP-like cAMP-binding protein
MNNEVLMTPEITAESVRKRFSHLFANLSTGEVAAVLAVTTTEAVESGAEVLSLGGEGGMLYLLWSGRLRVGIGGRDAPIVSLLLAEGAVCGDVSFIDRGPPTADVWADEPSVLLKISADSFDSLAMSNPRVARSLLHAICEDLTNRVRATSAHLLAVEARPTRHARLDDSTPTSREGWPARAVSSLFQR